MFAFMEDEKRKLCIRRTQKYFQIDDQQTFTGCR